jgi:hypothetical protein
VITLAPKRTIELGTVTYTLESRRKGQDWTFAGNLGTDPDAAQTGLDERRSFQLGTDSKVEYRVTATLTEVTEW